MRGRLSRYEVTNVNRLLQNTERHLGQGRYDLISTITNENESEKLQDRFEGLLDWLPLEDGSIEHDVLNADFDKMTTYQNIRIVIRTCLQQSKSMQTERECVLTSLSKSFLTEKSLPLFNHHTIETRECSSRVRER